MSITWTLEGTLWKTTDTERKRSLYDFTRAIGTPEEATYIFPIDTGTTDFDVGIPFDDAQFVAIFTDQDISLKTSLAGSSIAFSVCFIVMGTDIDQLLLSNSSGNQATVTIFIGGEPLPSGEPCP